ncbi:MAG: hypothetical protein MJZ32_10275 [Bacteroidaceae bacterium]|nr:hypothetical protein [Bacteroidaceae bacterium]
MGTIIANLTSEEKEILWLPFNVNCDEDYIKSLSKRLNEYKDLVKNKRIDADDIVVTELCEKLPLIITEYVKGNVLKAGKEFSDLMDSTLSKEINNYPDLWIKDIKEGPLRYYRSRTGKYSDPAELKHIPFNKLYLSKSDRYTSQGSVSLYLSTTKEASHVEIGNEDVTTAVYTLHADKEIKVFDMCAYNLNRLQGNGGSADANEEKSMFSLLPLIIACNSIAYNCHLNNKECKSITRNFKIEYVIPQMLASYIKEKFSDLNVRGIRYYTVRNEMLDPSSTAWMDLVLFTEYKPDKKYDSFLDESFDVTLK